MNFYVLAGVVVAFLFIIGGCLLAVMLSRKIDREVFKIDREGDEDSIPNRSIAKPKMEAWVNIVYTGTIYPKKQDPTKLFQALAEMIKDGEVCRDVIAVDFYGDVLPWLEKDIGKYGLAGVAKQHGRVSHEEAIQAQRDARILWVMKWEGIDKGDGWCGRLLSWLLLGKEGLKYSREYDREYAGKPETGVETQKLFEYMAARRPIMATGGQKDEVNKILDDIKMGSCAETAEEIKDFIRDIY